MHASRNRTAAGGTTWAFPGGGGRKEEERAWAEKG
jgi:hypothetical protein